MVTSNASSLSPLLLSFPLLVVVCLFVRGLLFFFFLFCCCCCYPSIDSSFKTDCSHTAHCNDHASAETRQKSILHSGGDGDGGDGGETCLTPTCPQRGVGGDPNSAMGEGLEGGKISGLEWGEEEDIHPNANCHPKNDTA